MTSGGWIFRRRCRLSGDCWSFTVFLLFSAELNDFVQVFAGDWCSLQWS